MIPLRGVRAPSTDKQVSQARLRLLLEHLREEPPRWSTRAALARALHWNLRGLDRALTALKAAGARFEHRPLEGDPRTRAFRMTRGPAWDEHLEGATGLALELAAQTLSRCGTLQWQDPLAALEALVAGHLSAPERRCFDQLRTAVRIQGGVQDPREGPGILATVLRALMGPWELDLAYQPAGAQEAQPRRVVPCTLTQDLFSGGAFLLVWDLDKAQARQLRLNRIRAAQVLPRPGRIPRPELLDRAARYQIGGWMSTDPPFEVTVRIHGRAWTRALEEAPPALPNYRGVPAADGESLLATFQANHANGAVRWILQFGGAAEVLGPEWIRELVREHHARALERMDGSKTGPPSQSRQPLSL